MQNSYRLTANLLADLIVTAATFVPVEEPKVEHKTIKYSDLPQYRAEGWAMIYDEWRRAPGYVPLHVAMIERVTRAGEDANG